MNLLTSLSDTKLHWSVLFLRMSWQPEIISTRPSRKFLSSLSSPPLLSSPDKFVLIISFMYCFSEIVHVCRYLSTSIEFKIISPEGIYGLESKRVSVYFIFSQREIFEPTHLISMTEKKNEAMQYQFFCPWNRSPKWGVSKMEGEDEPCRPVHEVGCPQYDLPHLHRRSCILTQLSSAVLSFPGLGKS